MAVLNHSKGIDWRKMALDFVDEGWNVRVPNADLMVETSTKEQYHGLIEG